MQTTILSSIVVIFGLSILVLFACYRLRIPAVVGFLLTGILAGPHGLRLVNESQNVETLAQLGVVLLLFTIGIEFSLKNLVTIKKTILIGGSLQVAMTIIAVSLISLRTGRSSRNRFCWDFCFLSAVPRSYSNDCRKKPRWKVRTAEWRLPFLFFRILS